MSKIGKKPIAIKEGVQVELNGNKVSVQGPKGVLTYDTPQAVRVNVENGFIQVNEVDPTQNTRNLFGLARALIANMITGVTIGFEKKLELSGVGYRAQVSGRDLMLSVGFSHQVRIPAPEGITFSVMENVITVSGINNVLVGDVAARIRSVRPPEPYKGKGIKYAGERIRRKVGKAAKAVGVK